MDYLANLRKTTTDVTYKVVKKTEEIIETSKIKYRIYDVKAEIEKVQAQIGKEVYAAYVEDRELSEVIEEKCHEIDKMKEKLEELKAMLQK